MEKWKVYMEIYQLKQQGFKIRRISRKLGISRTTVHKYLKKSPAEMNEWMASTRKRRQKLDAYELIIHTWLSEHPDLSASQVHDWLKEHYPKFNVGESTVRCYVKALREKYAIPKAEVKRDYEALADPPMGKQAQVDFGQTTQKTSGGKEIRLTFISFVLSHSRYKYVYWLDRPFTTRDVILAHEQAFQAFEGIPHEIVYDQDALLVVSENAGDVILTSEFQTYREERKLCLFVCRKADPESKGRIENVVGFVKHNFAKNRVFHHIEQWNEQCMAWLERTGNGKVHNTTKKRPVDVFALEKQHLRPVTSAITFSSINSSITRTVRKDNTIVYFANRYSVPLGTYTKSKQVYIEVTDEQRLKIKIERNGPVIAEHQVSEAKGELIQDRQHTRDRSKGIPAYMARVAAYFEDVPLAQAFLAELHRRYPRYMRDQLQIISKVIQAEPEVVVNEALRDCVHKGLYSATEFSDIIQHIKRQRSKNSTEAPIIKPLYVVNTDVLDTKPSKHGMQEYVAVLKGGAV